MKVVTLGRFDVLFPNFKILFAHFYNVVIGGLMSRLFWRVGFFFCAKEEDIRKKSKVELSLL
jgi:hypothetical protein